MKDRGTAYQNAGASKHLYESQSWARPIRTLTATSERSTRVPGSAIWRNPCSFRRSNSNGSSQPPSGPMAMRTFFLSGDLSRICIEGCGISLDYEREGLFFNFPCTLTETTISVSYLTHTRNRSFIDSSGMCNDSCMCTIGEYGIGFILKEDFEPFCNDDTRKCSIT